VGAAGAGAGAAPSAAGAALCCANVSKEFINVIVCPFACPEI
jgi:hypothetical protein